MAKETIINTAEQYVTRFAIENGLPIPRYIRRYETKNIYGVDENEQLCCDISRTRIVAFGQWGDDAKGEYRLEAEYVIETPVAAGGGWAGKPVRSVALIKCEVHGCYIWNRDFQETDLPLPPTADPNEVARGKGEPCNHLLPQSLAYQGQPRWIAPDGTVRCGWCGRPISRELLIKDMRFVRDQLAELGYHEVENMPSVRVAELVQFGLGIAKAITK